MGRPGAEGRDLEEMEGTMMIRARSRDMWPDGGQACCVYIRAQAVVTLRDREARCGTLARLWGVCRRPREE